MRPVSDHILPVKVQFPLVLNEMNSNALICPKGRLPSKEGQGYRIQAGVVNRRQTRGVSVLDCHAKTSH